METLHGRVRIEWAVRSVITAVVLGGILFGLDRVAELGLGLAIPVALAVLIIAIGVGHAILLYRDWRFDLESDSLYLERGVITRVETAVPYVRVQHVDTQRGPIDRVLGLSRVVVYTAGSRGADVSVPGLTPERARRLRNELRDLAVESEPEDAV
ncbi:PH domain-containing protein [Haloarchaeobius sp. HME9146]|uniref:PH domain-containing protein n=1 Tax=Haloarchaeobius sp. HME9146 TaxID=2978732 RepID=UPI0021C1FA06|nr:PH domain-containing protein [Haloarchaeobius sp. HME9146]MCT9097250.1 PH domain-containing protein [Haloarchaeobius sp. HME9146]